MEWTYKDAPLEGFPSGHTENWERIPGLSLHEDGYFRLPVVSEEWLKVSPHLVRRDGKAWFVVADVNVAFRYGDANDATTKVLYIDEDFVWMLWWDEYHFLSDPSQITIVYGSRGETGPQPLVPRPPPVPSVANGKRLGVVPQLVKERIAASVLTAWPAWPKKGERHAVRRLKDGTEYWHTVPYLRQTRVVTGTFSLRDIVKGPARAESAFENVIFRKGTILGPKTLPEAISRDSDWLKIAE